jgi:hypothetical protein
MTLASGICRADQALEREQVDAILKQLTDHPRDTWIDSGTVQATCLKYYGAEDAPIETTEQYIFDGTRFYWDIVINPNLALEDTTGVDSERLDYPDMKQNRHRIFCKNGRKYTRYYKSGNKAVVVLNQADDNDGSYGPLSTGIIPWGSGMFAYENLTKFQRIGWQTWEDGKQVVYLQLTKTQPAPMLTVTFALDVEKDYAILSCTLEDPQYSIIKKSYRDYFQVNEQWVPKIVTIERFQKTTTEPKLVSFEDVKFDSIEPDMPSDDSFNIEFSAGTLVELKPADSSQSWLYYATDKTDITSILEEKVNLLSDSQSENCATVAARHVAGRYARTIPQEKLSGLVSNENRKTSLYDLKKVFEEAGLHCNSVQIDLESLKQMQDGRAILHLSASNHYVILDHIDDQHVWYIDLISRKFYWKQHIDIFLREWAEGTALLVSNSPESIQLASNTLSTEQQLRIEGGQYGSFDCTEKIQNAIERTCPEPVGLLCKGAYYSFKERYGCREVTEPNKTCYGKNMQGYIFQQCVAIYHHDGTVSCTVPPYEEAFSREIRACN